MGYKQVSVRIPDEQHAELLRLADEMSTPHIKATTTDALRRVIGVGLAAVAMGQEADGRPEK